MNLKEYNADVMNENPFDKEPRQESKKISKEVLYDDGRKMTIFEDGTIDYSKGNVMYLRQHPDGRVERFDAN